jgi:hypothetical protein
MTFREADIQRVLQSKRRFVDIASGPEKALQFHDQIKILLSKHMKRWQNKSF